MSTSTIGGKDRIGIAHARPLDLTEVQHLTELDHSAFAYFAYGNLVPEKHCAVDEQG